MKIIKPFSTIAIPHKDILEGRLTMDVFAADLWEVFKGRAPAEYQDPIVFFRKTYKTNGLKNLIEIAEKRLKGGGGDPIIQLQTPFGGGKTHSLIALYHQAKNWKANTIVIDGSSLDPKEITIWEEIERQLTGRIGKLKGRTSPGREKLRELLDVHQPILILMDEILQYTTKASGIKVGDSSLASQMLAFIQELTGTVKTLDKSLLILTLPSSVLEHYDERAEQLFRQLQKITGRMEKVYTPVQDEEIGNVIRRRLFSSIDVVKARELIEEFLDYAEREKILPEGMEKSIYREEFIKSYPFQPEVVEILYERWGSFPTFQRTRGVLRLLSLVVYAMKDSSNPFIRLSDFNLKNDDIKRELIKHIGQEFDGIIAADIISSNSGAKKVDRSLGDVYSSFSFGTKAATTIFLYSFSGGLKKGATISEVKLSSVDLSNPSSIVVEAISKLKDKLFYVQFNEKLFFTNQPNLNRILLTKMDSVSNEIFTSEEKRIVLENLSKEYFDIFIWPSDSKDIPDIKGLKLVLMRDQDERKCKEFLENYGERPRVYRNTIIFLCPLNSERLIFEDFIKRKIAWESIEEDETLNLTSHQSKDVKDKIKKAENEISESVRSLYRIILLPSKDGFKEIDLGIPTHGEIFTINRRIYERLRTEEEILEGLAPLTLKTKYLKDKNYVETKNIIDSFYTTPGKIRIVSDKVLKDCIKEGVNKGLFGIGELEENKPICHYFKEEAYPVLVENEILIRAELCKPEIRVSDEDLQIYISKMRTSQKKEELDVIKKDIPWDKLLLKQEEMLENIIHMVSDKLEGYKPQKDKYKSIDLKLDVPSGKLSDVVRMVNYIKSVFNQVDVKVEIFSKNGEMLKSDYEDKIKEAINQASIIVEEEKLE